MIKRVDIGSIRLTFSVAPILKITGVNSYLDDSRHILMWDCDSSSLEEVERALRKVQARYFLSDIHILNTGRPNSYHAYCFTAVEWRRAVEILAATETIDLAYLRWCLFRGRLTLRTSLKMGRLPHKVKTLDGYCLPDATVRDLKSWVVYETIGGKEWFLKQILNWQAWWIRLICRFRRLLILRRCKSG